MSVVAKVKEPVDEEIFSVTENILSDDSKTHDVYFSDTFGQQLIAAPPSKRSAEEMAEALNCVRRLFLECSSDLEVTVVASDLHKVIRRHTKN